MAGRPDYYKTLGVGKGASDEEIEKGVPQAGARVSP